MNKNHLIVFLLCLAIVACNKKEKVLPVADFTADQTVGVSPFKVSFIDQSHYNPNIWKWNFGDGNTSNEQNPQHTYNSEGYFTVTLTVENQDGDHTIVKSRFIFIDSTLGQKCPGVPDFMYQGNWYSTVLIGSQCWMKQNLNYEIGESYCYNQENQNCNTYGRLYNWETIMNGEPSSNAVPSGVQGICPDGWHIPSDAEWKTLEGYVDPQFGVGHAEWDKTGKRGNFAGLNLKTKILWKEMPGNDAFGFSGKPAGACCGDPDNVAPHGGIVGCWSSKGYMTSYWSSTTLTSGSVYCRGLGWTDDLISRSAWDNYYCFFSLRCLKD